MRQLKDSAKAGQGGLAGEAGGEARGGLLGRLAVRGLCVDVINVLTAPLMPATRASSPECLHACMKHVNAHFSSMAAESDRPGQGGSGEAAGCESFVCAYILLMLVVRVSCVDIFY